MFVRPKKMRWVSNNFGWAKISSIISHSDFILCICDKESRAQDREINKAEDLGKPIACIMGVDADLPKLTALFCEPALMGLDFHKRRDAYFVSLLAHSMEVRRTHC